MDLSYRLSASNEGPNLEGQVINNLLFADDLVLLATSAINMQMLLAILSKWPRDFKINISQDKSQVITPSDEQWRIYSFEEERYMGLDQVLSYKYLGVNVSRRLSDTTSKGGVPLG